MRLGFSDGGTPWNRAQEQFSGLEQIGQDHDTRRERDNANASEDQIEVKTSE